jgi:hypothetical protein
MLTVDCNSTDLQETATSYQYWSVSSLKNNACFHERIYPDFLSTTYETYGFLPSIGIVECKTNGGDRGEFRQGQLTTKDKSILEKIENRLFRKLHLPSHWAENGIAPPNQPARMKAFDICKKLFESFNMVPDMIAPTVEEGVFLSYDNHVNSADRSLVIEVYNDLDVALLVNDNSAKSVVFSSDIKDFDFGNAVGKLTE